MTSDLISRIQTDLSLVKQIEERDQSSFENSEEPSIDKIFLNSSTKLRRKLEKDLYVAKAERAHELIKLRFFGNQMNGSIRLRALVGLMEPLNALIEHSAWRFWDKAGAIERIDEHFSNVLDLRLTGLVSGSTQLNIVGNTNPDLTGSSALEEGLKSIFRLLTSKNENFHDHIHDVGMTGCKSLSKFMDFMERRNLAVEIKWRAPDSEHSWDGRPDEITRVKTFLEDIGEPQVEAELFKGVIQVLSIRHKLEVYRPDLERKIIIGYHHSFVDEISKLHLGETREFFVEKTSYPIRAARQKKDAYSLKEII